MTQERLAGWEGEVVQTGASPYRESIGIRKGQVKRGHSLHAHRADGTVAHVSDHGDDWHMSFPDPTAHQHMEWTMRYGDPESIRFTVASVLSSYDYLLGGSITQGMAIERLKLLRAGHAALCKAGGLPPRDTILAPPPPPAVVGEGK